MTSASCFLPNIHDDRHSSHFLFLHAQHNFIKNQDVTRTPWSSLDQEICRRRHLELDYSLVASLLTLHPILGHLHPLLPPSLACPVERQGPEKKSISLVASAPNASKPYHEQHAGYYRQIPSSHSVPAQYSINRDQHIISTSSSALGMCRGDGFMGSEQRMVWVQREGQRRAVQGTIARNLRGKVEERRRAI
jgi:hypothetical protein